MQFPPKLPGVLQSPFCGTKDVDQHGALSFRGSSIPQNLYELTWTGSRAPSGLAAICSYIVSLFFMIRQQNPVGVSYAESGGMWGNPGVANVEFGMRTRVAVHLACTYRTRVGKLIKTCRVAELRIQKG